jgi:hypothetical protein
MRERRRGPLPRGASRSDVEGAFPDWTITDIEVADTEPDPIARFLKFESTIRTKRYDPAGVFDAVGTKTAD